MKFLKKLAPHGIAIVIFIALSSIYFSPLYKGYVVEQGDVKQHVGMSKEIVDYRVTHDGQEPLWTNSMFGGMPAYQISVIHQQNWIYHLDIAMKMGLPRPIAILFWTMIGFYIFALCLKINPWLSIVGAVAFGFSTINILYIGAGHMSKVNAISYMAPALGGFILAFRGKPLLGGAIFALFFALQVTANHLQMTYYLAFLLAAITISESIRIILKKEWKGLILRYGLLGLAAFIAILPAASNLLTTQEYGNHTTRGASELTIKPKGDQSSSIDEKGLNKKYILEYNYGDNEILSTAFPNAKGGAQEYLATNKSVQNIIEKDSKISEYSDYLLNTNPEKGSPFLTYFGGQASSGGAFYFGIVMILFALLGFIFIKDTLRWPFLVILILSTFLASNNPDGINGFFIDNFPMYNKFRDSKMILVLFQIIIPATALLFLNGILSQKQDGKLIDTTSHLGLKLDDKMAFGVCSGLAAYYGKNKNLFRGLMIAATLIMGWGIIVYLTLWFLLRKENKDNLNTSDKLNGGKKWWILGLVSILYGVIVLYIFPTISGSFLSPQELQVFKTKPGIPADQLELINGLKNSLIDVRIALFREDILRGLFLISIAGILFLLLERKTINKWWFIGLVFILVCFDNISVAKRYFNNDPVDEMVNTDQELKQIDSYKSMGYLDGIKAEEMLAKYEFEELTTIPKSLPSKSDSSILSREKSSIKNFESLKSNFVAKMANFANYSKINSQKTKDMIATFGTLNLNSNYRVFTFGNPFNETYTSYFHKSIGGYHGAKLKRYQELVEHYITKEVELLGKKLDTLINSQRKSEIERLQTILPKETNLQKVFDTLPIVLPENFVLLNMLNTRYLAINPSGAAIKNKGANGNAWFVSSIKTVSNANDEMTSLGKLNSKKEALLNSKDFPQMVNSIKKSYTLDSTDQISMTKYDVNRIEYSSSSKNELPAIFSEIWYPEGWNCYIDGKKTDKLFRANYILRGAIIPAGKHKIEWKFEPQSYITGSKVSLAGSIMLLVFTMGIILFNLIKNLKPRD